MKVTMMRHGSTNAVRAPVRRAWTAPQQLHLQAGKAEIGADPDNPEGTLADGS